MLRKPQLPLQQVVKRLSEVPQTVTPPPSKQPLLYEMHKDGPLPLQFSTAKQYRKVVTTDFCLSTKTGNNCIAVGQDIGLVQNIVLSSGQSSSSTDDLGTRNPISHIPAPPLE